MSMGMSMGPREGPGPGNGGGVEDRLDGVQEDRLWTNRQDLCALCAAHAPLSRDGTEHLDLRTGRRYPCQGRFRGGLPPSPSRVIR